MRRLRIGVILGLVIRIAFPSDVRAQAKPTFVAIEHVTVIDVDSGRERADQTVIIARGRITKVVPSARASITAAARHVDGRGRFLIPGLWDMHAHVLFELGNSGVHGEILLPLYLANGVTGLRDPGAPLRDVVRWRALVASGEILPLRTVVSGPALEPRDDPRPLFWHVRGAEEGRRAVDSLKRAGVDFIKVYSGLSRDEFFAIADEAKRVGLPFAGHLPIAGPTLADASNAGMTSIEHTFGYLLAGSPREEELRAYAARVLDTLRTVNAEIAFEKTLELEAEKTFDARRADSVYRILARNGTFASPTIAVLHMPAPRPDSSGWGDPGRWVYLPKFVQKLYLQARQRNTQLRPGARPNPPVLRPPGQPYTSTLNAAQERTFPLLRQAGVLFLTGTDNAPVQGFNVHDEMALLVAAGLTPLDALQSATLNPAKWMHATDSLGTVAAGKVGDLVLLDADPLADIHNTQRIHGVFLRGNYYDRAALDSLLAEPRRQFPDDATVGRTKAPAP